MKSQLCNKYNVKLNRKDVVCFINRCLKVIFSQNNNINSNNNNNLEKYLSYFHSRLSLEIGQEALLLDQQGVDVSLIVKVTGLLLPIVSLLACNISLCYSRTVIVLITRMIMMMMIRGSQPVSSDKLKLVTAGQLAKEVN